MIGKKVVVRCSEVNHYTLNFLTRKRNRVHNTGIPTKTLMLANELYNDSLNVFNLFLEFISKSSSLVVNSKSEWRIHMSK